MHVLIVAGPTCSGKSALALDLARTLNGVVVNADAMQVYAELRVLTARPSSADEAAAPHRLYGVRPVREPGSAAWWCHAATAEIVAAQAAGRLPILCGGTGLYFAALREGLSDLPNPGPAARAEARALLAELGSEGLHARLDPATAARLRPSDGQRVARAWEVLRGTGRGLADWQGTAIPPPWTFTAVRLDPPRPALRAAITARFDTMLAAGALDEVAALRGLDRALPAMRAHGVPELTAVLDGTLDLATARTRAVLATGQYTKRQATWFRHRSLADPARTHTIHARYEGNTQFSDAAWQTLVRFVRSSVDAVQRQD